MKLAKNIKKDFFLKKLFFSCIILSNAYVIEVFANFLRSPVQLAEKALKLMSRIC